MHEQDLNKILGLFDIAGFFVSNTCVLLKINAVTASPTMPLCKTASGRIVNSVAEATPGANYPKKISVAHVSFLAFILLGIS